MANKAIKIESGIPLPDNARRSGITAALRTIKVGDSFAWPKKDAPQSSVGACLHSLGKRIGYRFATRSTADGVRVWRVE